MADTVKSKDLGIQVQKKIFSRMANKNVAKILIDDVSSNVLDNLHRLAKYHSGNKREAEKLLKNIIKTFIKITVLDRNRSFSDEELKHVERLKSRFRSAAMSVVSFYEVDFSYDRNYLVSVLEEARTALVNLIARHLTDKSVAKVHVIFDFFCSPGFLDRVFHRDSEHRPVLGALVKDLNTLLDQGNL
ncbi:unnamed protein product [Bemisia tabaci]|uniref:Tumor necrosis factor alpha-induced protein 8-like protein n=1 Tax=Bemisia tabaci TaxID=7038 RepID=A0A9P0CDX9_BEMTA|nr:PREDICTED: tumor necrosis factor alpha-induced protein 8-like protein [Bemisia tabaci]CAH0773118.1 unnamed protein product [Bemisia tabaci]